MALILGTKAAPGRSTIHRWGLAAEAAAGEVLKPLDERCKGLVTTACLDEIFFRGVSSNGTGNWNKDEQELCLRPANDYPETTKWTPIA